YGLIYLSSIALPELFTNHLWRHTYYDLQFVNLWWGIFNLLPVLPFDGSHTASAIEEWVRKKSDGIGVNVISLLVSIGVGLWALSRRSLWVVVLMAMSARNTGGYLFQWIQYARDSRLHPTLAKARDAVKNSDGATAVQLAKEVVSSARYIKVKEEAER